jgi:hypothetical protein
MEVFSMELGIRLIFVKTSEFRGDFEPPQSPPSVRHWYMKLLTGYSSKSSMTHSVEYSGIDLFIYI